MTDPLGLIGPGAPLPPAHTVRAPAPKGDGPDFRTTLEKQIAEVNELQSDAEKAAEDYAVGRRDDVEGVIIATQKADAAFRMLLQVRNKMMDAYEEVKQVRV